MKLAVIGTLVPAGLLPDTRRSDLVAAHTETQPSSCMLCKGRFQRQAWILSLVSFA